MAQPSQLQALASITDALQDARVDCRVTAIGDQTHREELTVELELAIDDTGAFVLDDTGAAGDQDIAGAVADLENQLDALQAAVDDLLEPDHGPPAVASNGTHSPTPESENGDKPETAAADSGAKQSDPESPSGASEAPEKDERSDDGASGEDGELRLDDLPEAKRETLALIAELGESPSSDIADASDRGGARKHTRWLEDRSLVESRPDPDDGRRHLYQVSDSGAAILAEVDDAGGDESDDTDDTDDERDQDEHDQNERDGDGGADSADEDASQTVSDDPDEPAAEERDNTGTGGWDTEDWEPDESREDVEAAIAEAASVPELADTLDCGTERVLRVLGYYNLDEDALLDGGVDYEEIRAASDETHIEQSGDGADGYVAGEFNAEDPFADIDWLDEGTFWSAVEEVDTVHRLRSQLGWIEDEDGSLLNLLEAADAAGAFEGVQR